MSEDKHNESAPDAGDEKTALHVPDDEKEADGTIAIPQDDHELDSSKVKFINGGAAADTHIDFPKDSSGDQAFCGLTKEELQAYANDPYWVKVRWILLILFWVAWFGMLAAAIIIIIVAPKCPPRPNLDWWQKSIVYQCYPRSFQDTNEDGLGDLKGIENRVGYLKDLNVSAVWLNPIYPSPMADFGYDISDYKAIDSRFGTMEDFDNLRSKLHRNGMKLVMDFVPNHSSKNHTWFMESRKGKDNKYADYYIWDDGKPDVNGEPSPPNNWLSVFGKSAWTWDSSRNQFYYHSFLADQPDLNLRNPEVQKELEGVLRFWLDKGVDGFRVDAVSNLFESEDLTQDEPLSGNPEFGPEDHGYLKHTLTQFLSEGYELVTKWREIFDEYLELTEDYRFMAVEAYGVNETFGFYEYDGKKGADLPLNHVLTDLKAGCNGKCVSSLVHSWLNKMPANKWSSWVLGNHDRSRAATRLGGDGMYVNALNMLNLLLPGTAFTYYGEEIGMVDGVISWEDTKDPAGILAGEANYKKYSRDPERTPMQWSDQENAGFSEVTPWLPVNPDYKTNNVRLQKAHGAGKQNLEVYQELAVLRKEPSFQWGSYEDGRVANDNVYSFVRQATGFDGYVVAINFGDDLAIADFHAARPDLIPRSGVIAATTGNFKDPYRMKEFEVGKEIMLDDIHMKPGEGLVLKWAAADVPDEEQ